jgi:hypothetical protein
MPRRRIIIGVRVILGMGRSRLLGREWVPLNQRRKRPTSGPTQPTAKPNSASPNPLQLPPLLPLKRREKLLHDKRQNAKSPLGHRRIHIPTPIPLLYPSSFRTLPHLPAEVKIKKTAPRLTPTPQQMTHHDSSSISDGMMMISRVRLVNPLGSSAPSTRKNICVFHFISCPFFQSLTLPTTAATPALTTRNPKSDSQSHNRGKRCRQRRMRWMYKPPWRVF